MPFCSQCGNRVADIDAFCGKCGARQPMGQGTRPPATGSDPLGNLNPRTAAILCYIPAFGWIAAIIVLASQRFRRDRVMRFHAFQALYLFVAWLMEDRVFRPVLQSIGPHMHLHQLVEAVLVGASIFMMVKAAHNEPYSLPLFGELAHRSIVED